jgi:hypothetical protein
LSRKVDVQHIVVNELIDDINRIDVSKIGDTAKTYRFR